MKAYSVSSLVLAASVASTNAFVSFSIQHPQADIAKFRPHSSFDHSLNFWSELKDQEKENPTSVSSIGSFADGSLLDPQEDSEVPTSTMVLIGSSLFFFTYVVQRLQIYLNEPCLRGASICTEDYHAFAQFFADHEVLSFFMILTHAIPFVLLPWVSKVVSDVGPTIKKDFEGFNPFIMQMAMACIGFGLSLEFGWHVADSWYYENNFHVLNFGFYFFLISGFALWADGFKNIPIMDLVFGIILAAATCLYPYGNAVDVGLPERVPDFLIGFLEGGGPVSKIPLYAGMTATFLEITRRGKEIFGKQMYWVPVFCIGVNLYFIFLLAGVEYGTGSELTELNYIYHILHDILGTELGIFIFGMLVKNYVPLAERVDSIE